MVAVILSIKPKYAEKILSGEKKYEFRRQMFPIGVDLAYLYATDPVQKFLGTVEINGFISDNIDVIWDKTHEYAGITREEYDKYFTGRETVNAVILANPHKFLAPIDPRKHLKRWRAPQNYRYLPVNWKEWLSDAVHT